MRAATWVLLTGVLAVAFTAGCSGKTDNPTPRVEHPKDDPETHFKFELLDPHDIAAGETKELAFKVIRGKKVSQPIELSSIKGNNGITVTPDKLTLGPEDTRFKLTVTADKEARDRVSIELRASTSTVSLAATFEFDLKKTR
jgi:hypothetical protein